MRSRTLGWRLGWRVWPTLLASPSPTVLLLVPSDTIVVSPSAVEIANSRFANSGIYIEIGSLRKNLPSSYNIINATEVIGLDIE